MGDPPRDPKGELEDVYQNLMHPWFPARPLWPGHKIWIGVAGFLSLATVGLLPTIYLLSTRSRRREYDALFREGEFTSGEIRAVEGEGGAAIFKFEFQVGDTYYAGFTRFAREMRRHWGRGDTVPVLYDPEDLRRCCFVYR